MSEPAEIRIIGKDGSTLQTIPLQARMTEEEKKLTLPTTLAWYKESSSWLVTLATGALVLGLGFFDKGDVSALQRVAFGIAGLLLLIAVVSGVNAHLFVVNYGNLLEPAPERVSEAAKRALKSLHFFYPVMMRAFFGGIIAFAVFGFIRILQLKPAEVKPAYSFVPLTATTAQPAGVIVDTNRGAAWLVLNDARVVRLDGALPSTMPVAVRGSKLVMWSSVAGSGRIDGVPVVWMPEAARRALELSPLPPSHWTGAVRWSACAKDAPARSCDARIALCPDASICKTIEFVYLPQLRRFEWLAEEDVRSLAKGAKGSDLLVRALNGGGVTKQVLDAHGREVRTR